MRILVTGGAGFIGSHLCERLLQTGHQITILDDLNDFYSPAAKRRNLDAIRQAGKASFLQGDIRHAIAVSRALDMAKPEMIIHLAARAGVRPSLADPALYESVNVAGTLQLLEGARRAGVRKFVFASSSSVYGNTSRAPFQEDSGELLPISPYAATKIAAEKLCYTYSHLYGLNVVCLRFFTVYGPRQRPDLAIHKFSRLIEEGKPVPMFGNGSAGRDYTYIDDIVEGVTAALDLDVPFEILNLGNSHPVSLRELISELEEALGKKASIEHLPDQPGDVPLTYADISKARRLLGWQPRTPFSEGIRRFVEWLRNDLTA